MTEEEIDRVLERASRIAHLYNAGSAWGVSDAGFIIHRLMDIVEDYRKRLSESKA
jgi:hypothetical protein